VISYTLNYILINSDVNAQKLVVKYVSPRAAGAGEIKITTGF